MEKTKPVIACGDFNVAHRPNALKNDKANCNKTACYTQIEIDGMDNFIEAGFVASWKKCKWTRYLNQWSYSFNAPDRIKGRRIDYFLLSNSMILLFLNNPPRL